MPDRPPFPIPNVIDPPQFCLRICVPDDPIWKQVIAGLLFQPAEWFNWQRDEAKSGKELAQVWRKIYNEIDWSNMSCCPEPTPEQHRFTEEGHYQTSTDGGVTWEDDPTRDPRYSVPLAPPYLPPGTISEKCTYSDSIVEMFKSQFIESVDTAATIRDIAAVIAGVISAILGAIAAPLVYIIYITLAPAIYALGVAAWQAQFNDDVWNRLRCNLFNHMKSDGTFDQNGVDGIYDQIGTDETGLAAYTLRVVVATAGPVGLTNAARAGFGAPDADCEDCSDEPRVWYANGALATPIEIFPDEMGIYSIDCNVFYGTGYYGTFFLNDQVDPGDCSNGARFHFITGGAFDSVALKRGDCSTGGLADCLAVLQRFSFEPWSATFELAEYNAC